MPSQRIYLRINLFRYGVTNGHRECLGSVSPVEECPQFGHYVSSYQWKRRIGDIRKSWIKNRGSTWQGMEGVKYLFLFLPSRPTTKVDPERRLSHISGQSRATSPCVDKEWDFLICNIQSSYGHPRHPQSTFSPSRRTCAVRVLIDTVPLLEWGQSILQCQGSSEVFLYYLQGAGGGLWKSLAQ